MDSLASKNQVNTDGFKDAANRTNIPWAYQVFVSEYNVELVVDAGNGE